MSYVTHWRLLKVVIDVTIPPRGGRVNVKRLQIMPAHYNRPERKAMRENVREVCATCKHAVSAEDIGEDFFFCDQLLGPLCEYADSAAPSRVLVTGAEMGCVDHYERDASAYASIWSGEEDAEEGGEEIPLMFWGEICGEADHYGL